LCGAQFTYSHTSQHFMTSGGISFRLLEPLEWIRLRRHCSCKHAEHTHRKVRYIRAAFSSYPFSMLRERGEAKIASIEDRLSTTQQHTRQYLKEAKSHTRQEVTLRCCYCSCFRVPPAHRDRKRPETCDTAPAAPPGRCPLRAGECNGSAAIAFRPEFAFLSTACGTPSSASLLLLANLLAHSRLPTSCLSVLLPACLLSVRV